MSFVNRCWRKALRDEFDAPPFETGRLIGANFGYTFGYRHQFGEMGKCSVPNFARASRGNAF
jgi:hypothetical protein